jgi:hypothetical protein
MSSRLQSLYGSATHGGTIAPSGEPFIQSPLKQAGESSILLPLGGPPRSLPARGGVAPVGPPTLDPGFFHELGEVEVRPLESYEAAVAAVGP